MPLRVRALSDQERADLGRRARSRTLGAGLVRRAQIVLQALEGLTAPESSARMDRCGNTVRSWLNRFKARGLNGLEEDVRTGRPPTSSPEHRSAVIKRRHQAPSSSAVISAALTRPPDLGLPFASWPLDRLVADLARHGRGMRRRRISEIVRREGLKGRPEETWFGERVDPDFAKKSGDRATRHGATRRQHRGLPGRNGAASEQERSSDPGQQLVRPAAPEAERARQDIDDGRRGVAGSVFGAFPPASGEAFTRPCEHRPATNWGAVLSAVEAWSAPAVERVDAGLDAVLDNRNLHTGPAVLLFHRLHPRWEFVFQPLYAADLNLIEPWWQVLKSLALNGRRCEAWAEIERAVERATADGNDPKHPFVWGRRRRHRRPRRLGMAALPNLTRI